MAAFLDDDEDEEDPLFVPKIKPPGMGGPPSHKMPPLPMAGAKKDSMSSKLSMPIQQQ
jgi:hypothetical protein